MASEESEGVDILSAEAYKNIKSHDTNRPKLN